MDIPGSSPAKSPGRLHGVVSYLVCSGKIPLVQADRLAAQAQVTRETLMLLTAGDLRAAAGEA